MDSVKISELDARHLVSVMKVRFFPLVIDRADGRCRTVRADVVRDPDRDGERQSAQLGERLAALVPGDYEKKAWYGLRGSDANDCLAKLVPLPTGRRRMISFIGGYHGRTAGSAGLSGHSAQAKAGGGGNVVKIPYRDRTGRYSAPARCSPTSTPA